MLSRSLKVWYWNYFVLPQSCFQALRQDFLLQQDLRCVTATLWQLFSLPDVAHTVG